MHEAVTEVPQIFNLAWLIIVIPVIGLLINTFGGKNRSEGEIGWTAVIAAGGSFFVALLVVIGLLGLSPEERMLNHGVNVPLFTFFELGPSKLEMGLHIDALTGVMLMVVTFVGTLIHIYAIGYMHGDSRFQRFFIYLNLFMAMMLILVLANNYLMLFVGWEGVGLCSFLLIGFWFEKDANGNAAKKAMVANRVGDYGVMLAMFAMFIGVGSLQFSGVFEHAELGEVSAGLAMLITLLLVVGVTGKSAQIPLYVWLPDAMAGPTPVSALIHAATMVTAGVYLIARSEPLFHLVPEVQSFVGILGAVTALFAGSVALAQFDIKKVLAYSTVSQLGFMVAAVGMGATVAGVFHLMTHAFFKALLFLGAGSVIMGMHHNQDIRWMGGVRKYMPITWITSLLGSLALIGTPLFSGFYSKDSIIEAVHESHLPGAGFASFAVLAGVFVTAFYSFRMYFLVFHGKERYDQNPDAHHDDHHGHDDHGHDAKPHESPWVVTVPLILLAIPSVLIGYFTIDPMLFGEFFKDAIFIDAAKHPVMKELGEAFHGPLAMAMHAFTTAPFWLALAGVAVAYWFYMVSPSIPAAIAKVLRPLVVVLENKYYMDWINENIIARGARLLGGGLWKVGDRALIDGLVVNGSWKVVGLVSRGVRWIQTGLVNHYALYMILGVLVLMTWFVWQVK